MSDSFAYLSVMVSIVLGLAAAHLLGGIVRVINGRERTIVYWPSLLWTGTLFLIVAQLWWADASLRTYSGWNFAAFLVLLAQPAALYVLCALILPAPEPVPVLDMRADFMRNHAWFIRVFLLLIALSFVREAILYRRIPVDANFGALLLFAGVGLAALRFGSERMQKLNAVVAAVLTVAYIVLLFAALPGG